MKEEQSPQLEQHETSYTKLDKSVRLVIQLIVTALVLWLFVSGWINLWHKGSLPNPLTGRNGFEIGGTSIWSLGSAVILGWIISLGVIWEVEILLQRRKERRKRK